MRERKAAMERTYHIWLREGRTIICLNCGHILCRHTVNWEETYRGPCPNPGGILGKIEMNEEEVRYAADALKDKWVLEQIEGRLLPALESAEDRSFTTFVAIIGTTLTSKDKGFLQSVARKREPEAVAAWMFQVGMKAGFAAEGNLLGFVEV